MPGLHNSDEHPGSAGQSPTGTTVRLAYANDALQFGELHLPAGPGPHPVAIVIHGGFWHVPYNYTLMTSLAESLAKQGIAAWNIEYQRVGDAHGGWPTTLLDVAAAADFLGSFALRFHIDLRRAVSVGHSAGGQLALWLAARPRMPRDSVLAQGPPPLTITGAVSLAGVVDLEMGWRKNLGEGAVANLLGGSFNEVPERYAAASPAALVPLGVPQVLIHGTADDRVPFELSQSYAAAAQAAGDHVQLITLPETDHFMLINAASEAWTITAQSIKTLLHV